ncbi:MAG: 2-oxoacid:acceptor oxidoreductase family protein [candidate division WOR-3 bacterium]|nr:2-oxoacid:acceptor oxidoreductase family protein [candidate division WOR-3 bacterium]MDW8114543.1 2-oxoacid:acceptor oxidoreductase family protein [candidate division WOR-3 bacterium]
MKKEIRIAGTGGQGIIFAAIVLAEAVGVYENKYVCQTQSYGPEARGGASKADIIISDQPIYFPQTQKLDILACLSQQALEEYVEKLKENGILIIDSYYCDCKNFNKKDIQIYAFPFSLIAKEKLGRELFANIILLGSIARFTKIVKIESLTKVISQRVSSHFLEINQKALMLGYEIEV